ncbi:hypothetical protein [Pseudarthrobacter sp. PS3-L1]|uniref:hypothetical protein n=1 Tax=Pseudarthrobacter sp. PS3-L1 TaxID=3046207 RepID=UPI0024BB9EF5|nr:hypothetical protein [Pseudarthrobacter sp. PS3-L1]MDJ0321775.1 hypothetical protein [Pseudarthrobacter sp. PS3-L1]
MTTNTCLVPGRPADAAEHDVLTALEPGVDALPMRALGRDVVNDCTGRVWRLEA